MTECVLTPRRSCFIFQVKYGFKLCPINTFKCRKSHLLLKSSKLGLKGLLCSKLFEKLNIAEIRYSLLAPKLVFRTPFCVFFVFFAKKITSSA